MRECWTVGGCRAERGRRGGNWENCNGIINKIHLKRDLNGVFNLRAVGRLWPQMTMNVAQHKIINLLNHDEIFCDYVLQCQVK